MNNIMLHDYEWARATVMSRMNKSALQELHKREIAAMGKRHGMDYYYPPAEIIGIFHLARIKPLTAKEVMTVNSLVGKIKYKVNHEIKDKITFTEDEEEMSAIYIRHMIDKAINSAESFQYRESLANEEIQGL